MKYRVLYIDAWSDGCSCPQCGSTNIHETIKGDKLKCMSCLVELPESEFQVSWTWNNWFSTSMDYDESVNGELNDTNAFTFLTSEYVSPESKDKFEIEDDGYNLVLVDKENHHRPVYAIEYGSQL